uniref:Uncharacterized protein n=1 Tax=Cajanus cajan TaxID=3821 RepID=A0A151RQA7_CAJCA|nr:hypothetical protein KK1_033750 [Cajanus cajan]
MRFKSSKRGWMTIKVDLEKAYDHLSWQFVKETLLAIDLPYNFVDLVYTYISSPTMHVLWNGETLSDFSPTK